MSKPAADPPLPGAMPGRIPEDARPPADFLPVDVAKALLRTTRAGTLATLDRNILTSVSMALEAEGYRIITYTDGASALDGFKTSPPDLAILDIKMPRMDGMETLRRLRQKSDIPVIFLTSKDEEIDEMFGLKMGADDFIRKPFSQRLLVERVKAVLRRASPKDATAPKETDAKALERGQLRMDPERHTCTWKNDPVTLTVTEFLILGGEEDDRNVALLAQPAQRLHAVHARHLDVEDGEIRRRGLETVERGGAVGIGHDAIALGFERHRNGGQDIAVVVDESDCRHVAPLP